jgi:N-acetylglucosamine-6-phosphate deacetylase
MEMNRIKITNGRIILRDSIIPSGTLLVEEGKIIAVTAGDAEFSDARVIDAQGQYIAPGFIDIHVHGGGDHDFMDGTEEAFLKVAEMHAAHGTTSIMPTTLTADRKGILNTLEVYEQAHAKNKFGAQFIGLHLEGPYFSMNQRGAQDPRYIRDPDPDEYLEILSHSQSIKRWSAAPERKGAIAFGKVLCERGILPSMAHTDAIYEEALEAFENGYTLLTHFYSAMSGVIRKNAFRYAGVIEAGYLHDELDVEIIADGVHLPAPLLKLIYKIKGPEHIALITDAMRCAGMPEGESILGSRANGLPVIVEDGVAKMPDRSSFAGSVATADRLVRVMVEKAEVPLVDAIRMITHTPARIMKLDNKIGTLAAGMDADIVIFDENIRISRTILKGNIEIQQVRLED